MADEFGRIFGAHHPRRRLVRDKKAAFEILGEDQNPGEVMAKFILPADRIRETAMRELYRMNITWATLFPDTVRAAVLDGAFGDWRRPLESGWQGELETLRLAAEPARRARVR